MALIERIMHDSSEPDSRHIAVHLFFAAASEVLNGRLTSGQVQTFFGMTAADIVDWTAMAALLPAGNTALALAQKQQIVNGWHGLFIIAEGRHPGYDTPTAVRGKIGI